MDSTSPKKAWVLDQAAFDKLLANLDADRERAGQTYEDIRGKLVRFFEWRGSVFPEDHADEVINRVARKIDEGEPIRDFKNFVYGVARLFFLETLKEQNKEALALEQLSQPQMNYKPDEDESEPQHGCLAMCLRQLTAENRELIIQYYRKERGAKIDNRKALAQQLRIPLNALRIRAHRIRTKIEDCINDCLRQSPGDMK
jgi:DNA-directed RNA polymerase specialized sigma24 family protein